MGSPLGTCAIWCSMRCAGRVPGFSRPTCSAGWRA